MDQHALRRYHRWISLPIAIGLFLLISTGLLLSVKPYVTEMGAITVYFQTSDRQFLGTTTGLWERTESGVFPVNMPIGTSKVVGLTQDQNGVLWVAFQYGGVFRSDDGWVWQRVLTPEQSDPLEGIVATDKGLFLIGYDGLYYYQSDQFQLDIPNPGNGQFKKTLLKWHTAYFSKPLKWYYLLSMLGTLFLMLTGFWIWVKMAALKAKSR